MPPMEMICDAIAEDITIKPEQNIQAAKEAYESVRVYGPVE